MQGRAIPLAHATPWWASQFLAERPNKLANSCSRLPWSVLLWFGLASSRGGFGSLGRGTRDGGIVTASICSGAGPGATRAGAVDRRASVGERRARIGDECIGTASAAGTCSGAGAARAAVADGRAAVALGLRNAASS